MRTSTTVQVRFNDIDMAHHVHNAAYLNFFELARMDLLRRFIPADHDWRKQGLILARNEVDYRKPIHLSDTVTVDTWCSQVGTKSFDLRYEVFAGKGSDRILCAEGRSVMVCFDYAAGSSIAVPSEWRDALASKLGDN